MKTNVVAKADVMSLTIFIRCSKGCYATIQKDGSIISIILPSYKLGPNGVKIRQLSAHQIQEKNEVIKPLAMF